MNPITGMLGTASAFYSIISTVGPTLINVAGNVAHNFDEIKGNVGTIVSRLEHLAEDFKHLDLNSAAADIGAAWQAGMKVFEEIGVPRDFMEKVVNNQQNTPATSTIGRVVDFGEEILKGLTSIGLKVSPLKAA